MLLSKISAIKITLSFSDPWDPETYLESTTMFLLVKGCFNHGVNDHRRTFSDNVHLNMLLKFQVCPLIQKIGPLCFLNHTLKEELGNLFSIVDALLCVLCKDELKKLVEPKENGQNQKKKVDKENIK